MTGDFCQTPSTALPGELRDIFGASSLHNYDTIVGAVSDDACGDMGFNSALHFNKVCFLIFVASLFLAAQEKKNFREYCVLPMLINFYRFQPTQVTVLITNTKNKL